MVGAAGGAAGGVAGRSAHVPPGIARRGAQEDRTVTMWVPVESPVPGQPHTGGELLLELSYKTFEDEDDGGSDDSAYGTFADVRLHHTSPARSSHHNQHQQALTPEALPRHTPSPSAPSTSYAPEHSSGCVELVCGPV